MNYKEKNSSMRTMEMNGINNWRSMAQYVTLTTLSVLKF